MKNVVYQEESNLICSYCSVEHVGKITIVSAKDGKTVVSADIPEYACAFINDNKTLVCNTGKMYDVSNGTINKMKAEFEFVVGNVVEKNRFGSFVRGSTCLRILI